MSAPLLATVLVATAPSYYDDSGPNLLVNAGFFLILLGFEMLIIAVAFVVTGIMWAGAFGKAGFAKRKAFVPFYNTWILVKMAGRPESHFWLQLIPYAGIYWTICTYYDVARSFGKDAAYTAGLVLVPVVFASMLSYGDARYRGPSYLSPEQKWQAQQYAQWQAQQQYAQWYAQQHAQPQPGVKQDPNQPGSGPAQ